MVTECRSNVDLDVHLTVDLDDLQANSKYSEMVLEIVSVASSSLN